MNAFSKSEYTYWWAPITAMRSWQEERLRRHFGDPSTQQFKVVDDANGTIAAWAKWETPPRMVGLREGFVVYDDVGEPMSLGADSKDGGGKGREEADGKTSGKRYVLGPPVGSNITLFQKFFDGIVNIEKKYHANEKLVLTHLCTRHSYQRRGIGSALLCSILDLADREGLPTYLEASLVGASLYQSLGFETIDTLKFDQTETGSDTPVILYVMVREPRAA